VLPAGTGWRDQLQCPKSRLSGGRAAVPKPERALPSAGADPYHLTRANGKPAFHNCFAVIYPN